MAISAIDKKYWNPYYKKLGARIKEARKIAKFSQQELASFMNVERTTVTNIEAGRQTLRVDQLIYIARILGCDVTKLI